MDRRMVLKGLAGSIALVGVLPTILNSKMTDGDLERLAYDSVFEDEGKNSEYNVNSEPSLEGFREYYEDFRKHTNSDEFLKKVDERVKNLDHFPQYPEYQDWFKGVVKPYEVMLIPEKRDELMLDSCEGFLSSTEVMFHLEKLSSTKLFEDKFSLEEAYQRGILDLLAISYESGFWKNVKFNPGISTPEELSDAYSTMVEDVTNENLSMKLMNIERKLWPNYGEHFDSLK